MSTKKILCVCVSLAMAASMFAGCSREQTPEEIEAASLAAVAQEEQETGMRRLDSPYLEDYEKPLAEFVTGIQSKNADKIAASLGSVNIFGDTLDAWIISNNYESMKNMDLHNIRVMSAKDGKVAELDIFFEEPNEDKSNFVRYESDFNGTEWDVTPPTGLTENYTFYAPVVNVTVNDADMSKYAMSNKDYGYVFNVPRMITTDNTPDCTLKTNIGEYSGKIIDVSGSSYGSSVPVAMAIFTDAQKEEANQHFVDCVNSIFDLIRSGASQDSFSTYILDSNALSGVFKDKDEDKEAVIADANNVTGVSVMGAESGNYPDEYLYRFTSSDSITMDIRYSATLSSGECHKLATVTMTYTNGTWKIAKIQSNSSLFTGLTAFNPEW